MRKRTVVRPRNSAYRTMALTLRQWWNLRSWVPKRQAAGTETPAKRRNLKGCTLDVKVAAENSACQFREKFVCTMVEGNSSRAQVSQVSHCKRDFSPNWHFPEIGFTASGAGELRAIHTTEIIKQMLTTAESWSSAQHLAKGLFRWDPWNTLINTSSSFC